MADYFEARVGPEAGRNDYSLEFLAQQLKQFAEHSQAEGSLSQTDAAQLFVYAASSSHLIEAPVLLNIMERLLSRCEEGSLATSQLAVCSATKRLLRVQNREPREDAREAARRVLRVVLRAFLAGGLNSTLTPARISALDFAIESGAKDMAAQLASEPVYDIAPVSTYAAAGYSPLLPGAVSTYLITCGTALSASERWKEACDAFRSAGLLAAGDDAAALKLDALRRQLLTALIAYDSMSAAPRRVSQGLDIARIERELNKAYASLARACDSETAAPSAILAVLAEHSTVFAADRTQTLVGAIHEACLLRRVRKLGDTYTAVPMSMVVAAMNASAGRAGAVQEEAAVAEAQAFVTRAISRGQLAATVNLATRQLTFAVEGKRAGREGVDEGRLEGLTAAVTRVQQLVSTLRSADAQLTLQPTVYKRLAKGGSKGGRGGIDFGTVSGSGLDEGMGGGGAGGGFWAPSGSSIRAPMSEDAQLAWATQESLRSTPGL